MSGLRVVTRMADPHRSMGSLDVDPVDALRPMGRVALLAPSPHVAEAVASGCARDAGGRAVVLDASDGAGLSWLRRARVADHELVIVLRGVRAADPASISAAAQLAEARPGARLVAATDRTAAHALRPRGFRLLPLRAQPPAELTRPAPQEIRAAVRTVHSGGDPLACPANDLPATPGSLPLARTSDGRCMMWTDAWRFSRALAAAFDHSGLGRLGTDALAEPAVRGAIEIWAGSKVGDGPGDPLLGERTEEIEAVLALGALVRVERVRAGQRFAFAAADAERARRFGAHGDRLLRELAGRGEPSLLVPVADALDELDWWSSGAQHLRLPETGLATEPVCVADFARFVRADGYRDSRWWPHGQPGAVEPLDWASQLRHPSRPVVGINRVEVDAFLRWASATTGREIALQSTVDHHEVESSPYPWGASEPERTLLNYDQHVGYPSSPRAYPLGRGKLGHRDLAGNVWEWTDDGDAEVAVAVGGSWSSAADEVASGRWIACRRGARFDDVGFRVQAR